MVLLCCGCLPLCAPRVALLLPLEERGLCPRLEQRLLVGVQAPPGEAGRGDSMWSWDLGTVARALSVARKPRSALWLFVTAGDIWVARKPSRLTDP